MKTQVIVIHGGNAFEKYEDYISSLRTKEVSLERLQFKNWKSTMADRLGEDFDVLCPQMPNSANARYLEWKIWFERITPLFGTEVILIGHSLGGIFLAKYLSENELPKKIIATFLIASPFNTADQHPLVDFIISKDLTRLEKQGGKIFIYHSKDDTIVPFSDSESYAEALPKAELRVFEDKGHFNMLEFPELVEGIRNIV